MGRPLSKKYFGNTDPQGVGGEGIQSVTSSTGSNYSSGVYATVAAPDLPGGRTATVSPVVTEPNGHITGYVVTLSGSGYLTSPTVTLHKPTTQTATYDDDSGVVLSVLTSSVSGTIYPGMVVSGTGYTSSQKVVSVDIGPTNTNITLTAVRDNAASGTMTFTDTGSGAGTLTATLTQHRQQAIEITAYVQGGSSGVIGDIVKQKTSTGYIVRTAQGESFVTLAAVDTGSLAPGQANVLAYDHNGSSYYVTKITAHKVRIVRKTIGSAWSYPSDWEVPWSFAAAISGRVRLAGTP